MAIMRGCANLKELLLLKIHHTTFLLNKIIEFNEVHTSQVAIFPVQQTPVQKSDII
jgi:hypothetical protein